MSRKTDRRPFHAPSNWRRNGQRAFLHHDLSEEELDSLADVVCDIKEPKVRARSCGRSVDVQGSLQVRDIAYDSYLESIDTGIPVHYAGQQIERTLQIAKLCSMTKAETEQSLGIAKQSLTDCLVAGETASWRQIAGILARTAIRTNAPVSLAEQIWEQATESTGQGRFRVCFRLREQALQHFRTNGDSGRAKEAQVELVRKLVEARRTGSQRR